MIDRQYIAFSVYAVVSLSALVRCGLSHTLYNHQCLIFLSTLPNSIDSFGIYL